MISKGGRSRPSSASRRARCWQPVRPPRTTAAQSCRLGPVSEFRSPRARTRAESGAFHWRPRVSMEPDGSTPDRPSASPVAFVRASARLTIRHIFDLQRATKDDADAVHGRGPPRPINILCKHSKIRAAKGRIERVAQCQRCSAPPPSMAGHVRDARGSDGKALAEAAAAPVTAPSDSQ